MAQAPPWLTFFQKKIKTLVIFSAGYSRKEENLIIRKNVSFLKYAEPCGSYKHSHSYGSAVIVSKYRAMRLRTIELRISSFILHNRDLLSRTIYPIASDLLFSRVDRRVGFFPFIFSATRRWLVRRVGCTYGHRVQRVVSTFESTHESIRAIRKSHFARAIKRLAMQNCTPHINYAYIVVRTIG